MNKTVNSGVRKNNYERGLKNGSKVYCGQDLRELVGMRIVEVHSDDNDANVILWAEEDNRSMAVYFDDTCFDGEHMRVVDHTGGNCGILLRPVTESDLKEILNMPHYYDLKIAGENDEEIGVHQLYCNDPDIEGTEEFNVKSLYVFYDGRILTEK